MRRWVLTTGVIAAVWCAGAAAWGQERSTRQIVFVDMDRVFSEYHKTRRADARLKEQAEEFSEERNELVQSLRDLEASFNAARQEAQDETLSKEAREEKRTEAEEKLVELREKETEIRQFEESRRNQLDEQRRRIRKRIVDEITEVLERYAERRDLFAIIDSSGQSLNQVPVILYALPEADVTDEVLALLNEGQPEAGELEEGSDDEADDGQGASSPGGADGAASRGD